MRKIFLIANWKQSGTRKQTLTWLEQIGKEIPLHTEEIHLIVCPPLKGLDLVSQYIEDKSLPIDVGIQDIDTNVFEGEKNTGSMSPGLLVDSATYVIIGHSETRNNYRLADEDVAKKIMVAKNHNFTPIVCISELSQVEKLNKDFSDIVAYEPLFAVGTGVPDSPENVNAMVEKIGAILPKASIIYGGSVDGNNIKGFLATGSLSGILVGNRSLDPSFFLEIIKNAH